MVDYALYIIIAAVVAGLTLVGCVVFIIQFQHPDDRIAAWGPKFIVLLGLFLACSTILLLPFDASMSQACESDPHCPAMTGLGVAWYICFISIAVMAFAVIPLAYFFYETDDEEGLASRIMTSICWSIVNLFVFISILLGMYFTIGYVELPVEVIQPYQEPKGTFFFDPTEPKPSYSIVNKGATWGATQTIQTSLVIYILALLSFLGWFLTTFFGGIGMIMLPMDLIGAWIHRPRPIDLGQFAERKLLLKKKCEGLISLGKESQDKFKKKKNGRKERTFTNKYRKLVLDLEEEMQILNLCYKKNEINPILPWFHLSAGIFSWIITFSWLLQLILEVFLAGIAPPFLSGIFVSLSDAFPLFGVVAYGIFAFYLLIAVVKGSIFFAGRFFLISIHPMKVNGTMMNSFLFNVGILLICSVSCTQLCATAFRQFAHSSAVSQIFVSQIQYLKFFSYFYSVDVPVFYSLLFIVALLAFLYSMIKIFFCHKKQADTVTDMMNEMRRDMAS